MKKAFYLLMILCSTFSCSKNHTASTPSPNPITPVPPPSVVSNFAKGADISWLTEMETSGRKFYTPAGTEQDCVTLLRSLGLNTARLRVWVNPTPAWNNAADVIVKALRAKNAGFRIMIDFHYSDSWADPGQQTKPAAWAGMDAAGLKVALATHTADVLTQLKNNGITPEWVQVGNETNNGMLWPEGKASVNMVNFTRMVNAGYDAVKAVFPAAKVIVHVSNGWDNSLFRWMFDGLKVNNAKFDIIGMSLYPSPSNWGTLNTQCMLNMNDMVSRYTKEVMIVEVGMSWDSPVETRLFLADLIMKTKSVTNSKGLGVLYWEPQAYNGWKGYTLGAFDNSGKPTAALDAFAN